MDALDRMRIATPCEARWKDMIGDDRSRLCALCDRRVYDVSRLQRAEALALVAAQEGPRPCVRLWRRADGRVMTADCPVGVRTRLKRASVAAAFALVAALGLAGAVVGAPAVGSKLERWLERAFPTWFGSSSAPMGYIIF